MRVKAELQECMAKIDGDDDAANKARNRTEEFREKEKDNYNSVQIFMKSEQPDVIPDMTPVQPDYTQPSAPQRTQPAPQPRIQQSNPCYNYSRPAPAPQRTPPHGSVVQ